MPRPVKSASEVLAEQDLPVADTSELVTETPAPVAEVPVVEAPKAEEPPPAEPEAPKPFVRFQINQIQKITFPDRSEYLATHGIHDITDMDLAAKLKAYANGGKRQIFILES